MTNTNDHGREKDARSGDEKGFEQRFETGPGETMNMDDRQHDLLCRSHFGEELTDAEQAELEAALAASEELRAARDELQATAALVRGALKDDITLDAARRTAVLDAARAGAAPAPGGGQVLRLLRYASLPLAAGFAGMMWWNAQQEALDTQSGGEIRYGRESTTVVADAAPEEASQATRGGRAIGYASVDSQTEWNGQTVLRGLGYTAAGGPPSGATRVTRPKASRGASPAMLPSKADSRMKDTSRPDAETAVFDLEPWDVASGRVDTAGVEFRGLGQPSDAEVDLVAGMAALGLDNGRVESSSDAFYLGRGTETLGVGGGAGGAPVHSGSPGGGAYRGPGDTTPPTSGGGGPTTPGSAGQGSAGPGAAAGQVPFTGRPGLAETRTFTWRDMAAAGEKKAEGSSSFAPATGGSPESSPSVAEDTEGLAWTPNHGSTTRKRKKLEALADGVAETADVGAFFDEGADDKLRARVESLYAGAGLEVDERLRLQLVGPHLGTSSAYRALHCEPRPLPKERPRDMFFRFWGDNPFVIADADALSTFAADVDTASFALAERMLKEGHVPAREQIRTEEFVNFLTPDLAPPTEGTFAVHSELSASPFGGREDRYLLRVGVRAKEVAREERPPLALTFVVDVSGSMENGGRLELVKHALRLLTAQLDGRDTIAIVAFSNEAREVLRATPASRADLIETALFGLSPGGGTNAEAGIRLGYERAALDAVPDGAQRRVVFLSDGVANIGQTDQSAIAAEVARRVEEGVFLNTIGVGLENFNDVFLEQLANDGQGVCDYVADAEGARRAIVDRFTGGFVTVAKDVKIQVEFDPAVVLRWRQLGYENRAVADRDFRNDKIDAGEIGAGHQVTCLYELELASTDARREAPLATARVRYAPVDGNQTGAVIEREHRVDYTAALAPTFRGASHGFRRAALAAQLAEILRGSVHTAGDTIRGLGQECAALLQDAMDEDTARVAELVKRSMDLGVDARPAFDPADPDAAHRRAYYESLIESLGGAAPDRDTEDLDALLDSVQKLLERSRRRKAR